MLEDGTYEVIVVDATNSPDDSDLIQIEIAILAGPHKGEIVGISAAGLGRCDFEILGTPGTLTVADEVPSLMLED